MTIRLVGLPGLGKFAPGLFDLSLSGVVFGVFFHVRSALFDLLALMKKINLALCSGLLSASACLPVAAMAQSSVTLYGIIDTDVTYLNHVRNAQGHSSSQVAMASGGEFGSRFGMRGTEDLGGGNKAIFVLEQGFNGNNGTMTDSTRQFSRLAYVGLSSHYGALTLGRQYSALFDTMAPFFPQGRSVTFEPYNQMINNYIDNSIKYTGQYRGFTVVGLAALGGVAGNFRSSASYSLGVQYANGPLLLGVAADQSNLAANTVTTAAPIGTVGEVQRADAGARYKFGKSTFYAGYKWGNTQNAAGASIQRDRVYWGGVRYAFRPDLTALLAYYYEDLRRVGKVDLANPEQLTLQVDYFFSKTTSVYSAVSHTWHSAMNFAAVSTLPNGINDQTGVSIGLRHVF